MFSRADVPGPDPARDVEHEDRVVAHARDQQPELLELGVRHAQLGGRGTQLLARQLAAGEVARDLPEADERALLVVQRRDDDVGPEPRAVLAYAPALGLVAPVRAGRLEDPGRDAELHLVGRIEDREVLADDLVRAVALQPPGAVVPAHHVTGGVEQEDRVVRLRLDQQAQIVSCVARRDRHADVATRRHLYDPTAQPRARSPYGFKCARLVRPPWLTRGGGKPSLDLAFPPALGGSWSPTLRRDRSRPSGVTTR